MLQMIILFIMASVVVVTGLVTVSQAQIQGRAREYTQINQRLDVAAKAVEQTMKEYPGMTDVGVLAPELSPSGMPIIPGAMGTVRVTPWGSFFRYCPIANQDVRAVISDNVITEVSPNSGSSAYNVTSYRGTIIHDNIAMSGYGVAGIKAIKNAGGAAIITAPAKSNGVSPSCNSVSFVNNKPVVPNGFIRIVNFPNEANALGDGVTSRKMSNYFVSQTGTGDMSGSNSVNTAPIIAILSELTENKSSEVSINIIGAISPPWENWNSFLTKSAVGRRVYISGGEIIIPSNPGSLGFFPILGDWELKNITVTNGSALINSSSKLSLTGNIVWRTNSVQRSSIYNLPGGRFDIYNANVKFEIVTQTDGQGSSPLDNNGEMNFKDANIWTSGVPAKEILFNRSEVYSKNSKIGTQSNFSGQRPTIAGVTFIGNKAKLIGSGNNYVIAGTNYCWDDRNTGSYVIRYANFVVIGEALSFPAENAYAESSLTNPSSAYLNEAAERRVARENASGTFICI